MGSNDKRYSTKTEIASSLKISPTTLDRLRKSGRIKSIKVGSLVRFDPNDLFNTESQPVATERILQAVIPNQTRKPSDC